MSQSKYIFAHPVSLTTDKLPDSWHWWKQSNPANFNFDQFFIYSETKPDNEERIVSHTPGKVLKKWTAQELKNEASNIYEAWLAHNDNAGERLTTLPRVHQIQTLKRLGYGSEYSSVHPKWNRQPTSTSSDAYEILDVHPVDAPIGSIIHKEQWKSVPENWIISSKDKEARESAFYISASKSIVRAPLGTVLPDGWQEIPAELVENGQAPMDFDSSTAFAFSAEWSWGHMAGSIETIGFVKQESDGRWTYGNGSGGDTVIRGVSNNQDEAIQNATDSVNKARVARLQQFEKMALRCGNDTNWLSAIPSLPEIQIINKTKTLTTN